MITFKKIRYRNFLSSGNQFTEIDFQKNHTNILVGCNGSGKCVDINTKVKLRNKKNGEILELTVGEFYDLQKKQTN
jgi:ABC-type cobalamin/Fe3+-siderophores transport system ATPase subunit